MIKAIYEKQDDIPKEHLPLFTEKNEKWELTEVEGIKTQVDIDRLDDSIKKERESHKGTKTKLSIWKDYEFDDVKAKLDKYPELETYFEEKGGLNEEKIDKIVEGRVNIKMGVAQKEIDQLKEENGTLNTENGIYKKEGIDRKIKDHVLESTLKSKVVTSAVQDIVMLAQSVFHINDEGNVRTKDNIGVTPGVDSEVWLMEMQKTRPHWWAPSSGGGSQGGQKNNGMGKNPWSAEHWNMTNQGAIVKEHGLEKAQEYAKSENSHVGAIRATVIKK